MKKSSNFQLNPLKIERADFKCPQSPYKSYHTFYKSCQTLNSTFGYTGKFLEDKIAATWWSNLLPPLCGTMVASKHLKEFSHSYYLIKFVNEEVKCHSKQNISFPNISLTVRGDFALFTGDRLILITENLFWVFIR